MPLAISNRYATALADVVGKPDSSVTPEAALEQLHAVQSLLGESSELLNALTSPAVKPAEKRRIVRILGERLGLADAVRNFLFVVIDHRRLRLLGDMIGAFQSWFDNRQGVARIEVVSAQPLDEALRNSLLQRFGDVTRKTVKGGFEVDPALLGGVVVRHGSTVFDGSIRSQLRALNRAISGEA